MHLKFTAAVLTILMFNCSFFASAQSPNEPWKASQLMSAQTLADRIQSGQKPAPLVICVGPSALIKGSVDAGEAHEKSSLGQLRSILAKEPNNREVVIYCGCCPFDKCPNIRPAFDLLNQLKFSDAKLLNLPKNMKADWIDKQYPINEE